MPLSAAHLKAIAIDGIPDHVVQDAFAQLLMRLPAHLREHDPASVRQWAHQMLPIVLSRIFASGYCQMMAAEGKLDLAKVHVDWPEITFDIPPGSLGLN